MRAVVAEGGVCKIVDAPRPSPGPREVLLRVQATAVNRAGKYDPPPGVTQVLGLEAAGVVEEVGVECTSGVKVGDRVMVLLAGGGYAEHAAVDERHVIPVPDAMSVTDAAAIPEVWLTAFQLLHLVGKVQPGDTVLVHAGGSGVGTAATQLAVMHGARVIITAGGEAKRAHALELGASHAFARGDGWADEVLKATDGRGVDLVLDCVGGSYWQQNVAALAVDGRWVVYGLMGGAAVEGPLLGAVLRKRLVITGTTLRARSNDYKAELVVSFVKTALPAFSGDAPKLKPIVDRVIPFGNVQEAHEAMEANQNMGKIVLLVDLSAEAARSDL